MDLFKGLFVSECIGYQDGDNSPWQRESREFSSVVH